MLRCVLALLASPVVPTASAAEEPDAVIEDWYQHWDVQTDGSVIYHERKHVLLNNDRAYRAFADPRITFRQGHDELRVISAETHLPDGSIVEVPPYGRNEVTPRETAGWPAFADLRQLVLSMSGVRPGCVVQYEYELREPAPAGHPGERPRVFRDLRLDLIYPTTRRIIEVTAPPDVPIHTRLIRSISLPGRAGAPADHRLEFAGSFRLEVTEEGTRLTSGSPTNPLPSLPAVPWTLRRSQPNAPPWQEWSRRFLFTTSNQWIEERIARLEQAADRSTLAEELTQDWTKEVLTDADKMAAIQEGFAESFNFVRFDSFLQPGTVRPASAVLRDNYGVEGEAAAALLALARAADLPVSPAVFTREWDSNPTEPVAEASATYGVVFRMGNTHEFWHPRTGKVSRSGALNGDHAAFIDHGKEFRRHHWPVWNNADESRCHIVGVLKVDKNGVLSGKLSLETSGLFVDRATLASSDQQTERAQALLRHVVPELTLAEFNVSRLTETAFDASAQVSLPDGLEKLSGPDGPRRFELCVDGPHTRNISMPLAHSVRTLPVRLAGAFEELIDIEITWPEGWEAEFIPTGVDRDMLGAGTVRQTVTEKDNGIRLRRLIRFDRRDTAAADFLKLRRPLNRLRSASGRTLLLRLPATELRP